MDEQERILLAYCGAFCALEALSSMPVLAIAAKEPSILGGLAAAFAKRAMATVNSVEGRHVATNAMNAALPRYEEFLSIMPDPMLESIKNADSKLKENEQ
jgi:hypothetical protein